jgi:hypothetical protein
MLTNRVLRQFRIGVRFNVAKLGQRARRMALLPMLVGEADLSSPNWKMLNDVALRPGFVGFGDETEIRARKIGSTLAVRTFIDSRGSRWLTLRVLPLATREDAVSWSSKLKERSTTNRSSASHISEEFVGVSKGLSFEFVDESSGAHFFVKSTAGFVGSVAFGVRFMAREDTLSWEDVVAVASIQGQRIHDVLNGQDSPEF